MADPQTTKEGDGMTDEAMKTQYQAPDYRKAMLYHSDRADEYMSKYYALQASTCALLSRAEQIIMEIVPDDFFAGSKAEHLIADIRAAIKAARGSHE